MKNKIFYPFIIIEFLLFVFSTIAAMGSVDFSDTYLRFSSVVLCFLFILVAVNRNKTDKIFGSLFALSIIAAEVFATILSANLINKFMAVLFYVLSQVIVLVRLFKELKIKIWKDFLVVGGIIILANVILLLTNTFTWFYFIASVYGVLIINNVVLAIMEYKKTNPLYRPNWFFLAVGLAFIAICHLNVLLQGFVGETAALRSIIDLSAYTFFIPGLVIATVSFMLFEPREA